MRKITVPLIAVFLVLATALWLVFVGEGPRPAYQKMTPWVDWDVFAQTYHRMATAYGELYEDNAGGTSITITDAATYYPWVSTTAGLSRNITLSVANDNITVIHDEAFLITAQVSFAGSNSTVYTWAIHHNDSAVTGLKVQRTIGTGTDIGSTSMSGVMDLAAGDTLNLEVLANGASKTATVYYAQLTIVSLN